MKHITFLFAFLALGLASAAPCANLSDNSTWGESIVNSSGVLYVNANTTLCTDTYYLNAAAATAMFQMNASNIFLDCNGSTIDGVDKNGFGVYITGMENDTVENCTVRNYERGVYVYNNARYNRVAYSTAYNTSQGFYLKTTVSNNTLISNTAYSNSYAGFFLYIGATNNTLINNTAYNNVYFGFSLQTNSNGNTLINNTAYNNSPFGFDVSSSSNNTFTDSIAFGNFEYAGLNGYGIEIDAMSSNSIGNTFTNTFIYNQSSYIYQKATAAQSNNFTNLTLGYNETIGLINYQFLNMTDLYLNSSNLKLDPYFVSLDSTSAPQANLSANITLSSVCNSTVQPDVYTLAGFPSSRADIVSTGSVYPTGSSCGSGTMTFEALGFSGYALGPITTTLTMNFSPSNLTTYKTETNVSCTSSNGVAVMGLYVNGTLVAGPSTSHIEYLTNHSGGYYNYTCNTTGDENYSAAVNSSVLQMQRASPTITFNVTPSTPITVGNETNLSCSVDNTQVDVEIFINGASVGSAVQQFEYLDNLTVGTYNFTCNTTGNENYTNASGSMNGYMVEQRNTTLDLTMPSERPMVGEETNVSCRANTGEINISLYRNGMRVANGTVQIDDVAVLPAGLYTYICNTSGSDNYTSYSVSGILRFQRSSTTSSSEAQCSLEVVVPGDVTAGSKAQLQVLRSTDGSSGSASVYLATVAIAGEGEAATLTTSTNGYVSFMPAEAGTYAYAAEFGDCEGADGTFTAVEAEEGQAPAEPAVEPAEEPSAEPSGQGGSTGGQPSEVEVPSSPECTIDADCAPGFGCQNGSCVTLSSSGQPAAQGEGTPAAGAASSQPVQQGVPWWAWLLILIIVGAGAWWLLGRKKV
jgi:parallel beta-helix repeat protein